MSRSRSDSFTTIDDRDSAVSRTGDWVDGGTTNEHNGTVSSSTTEGDSLTVTFTGTEIMVYGTIDDSSAGVAESYQIDDAASSSVTHKGSDGKGDSYQQKFWESGTLSLKEHKLVITMEHVNTGFGDNEGTVWFDYFDVANMASSSSSTSSSASSTGGASPTSTSTSSGHKSPPVGAIIGGLIGAIAIIILLILAFFWYRSRRRRQGTYPAMDLNSGPSPSYHYQTLPLGPMGARGPTPPPKTTTQYSGPDPFTSHMDGVAPVSYLPPAPAVTGSQTSQTHSTSPPSGLPEKSPPVVMAYRTGIDNAEASSSSSASRPRDTLPDLKQRQSDVVRGQLRNETTPEPELVQHMDSGIRTGRTVELPPTYTPE